MGGASADRTPEPSRRVVRVFDGVIVAGIALAALNLLFALQLHRPRTIQILTGATALLLAASLRLRPVRRVQLALVVLPAALAGYGLEWRIARARPYDATAAARRGVAFDTRSLWERIRATRGDGIDAYPSLMPRALLVLDLAQGLDTDETASTPAREWGVVVGGRRLLPLGGISGRTIVHCNEGGAYSTYPSDERGFNNPKGIWGRDTVDVGLLGDSFTQAACVGPDENAAAWIRRRYPATLNLGMAGNGPLLELAGLEEYLAPRRPKVVLWVYYTNDLADLDVEKQSPLLRRYLDEDGFSQGLSADQEGIDRALVGVADRIDALAPSWPGWLAGLGLTRRSAPIWFGDLAMRESHSSITAVLRLDRLSFAVSEQLGAERARAPADIALFERVLARARDRVASWGGRLHFVYMADMRYLSRTRGPRASNTREDVLAAVRRVGLPLIDTHPVFLALPDPQQALFHPDSHCNPEGQRVVAETILKAL